MEQLITVQLTPDQLRGINHSVSTAIALTKRSDPQEITSVLTKAANFLFQVQKVNNIECSLLNVDFYVFQDEQFLD